MVVGADGSDRRLLDLARLPRARESDVTPLTELLIRRIRLGGPITVAEYMAEALGHPRHGYYRRADPFGLAGDFVTSPEISQMFGELLGAWCADIWSKMGPPDPVRLIEYGPGRGTLMADALRATSRATGFHPALDLHFIETSPLLRQLQAEAIAAAKLALAPAHWHDGLETVPDGPLILLTNELFDALPIHQFQSRGRRWHERVVGLNQPGDGLAFGLRAPGPQLALVRHNAALLPEGTIVEVCPAGIAIADRIARRIAAHGGAALIIDYGQDGGGTGESLQAVRRHGKHDPLDEPGSADLSAHVDFGMLGEAARQAGAMTHGPIPQNLLLERLGIRIRADALMKAATAAQAADISASLERLLHLEQMGTLFKALAITAPDLPTPAGFE
ncbi:MAG: class I SAM-dependent methyltransferase [Dongiaceae bacterium]